MFWNFLILMLGIISAIYAMPYGNWEITHKNIIGGITIYSIAIAGISLVVIQMLV